MTNWSPTTSSPPGGDEDCVRKVRLLVQPLARIREQRLQGLLIFPRQHCSRGLPVQSLIEDLRGRASHRLELDRSDDSGLFRNRAVVVKRVFEPGIADGEKIERRFRRRGARIETGLPAFAVLDARSS